MRLFLHRLPAVGGLLLFTLLGAAALAAPRYFSGNAATLTVTTIADSGPGSLRQALVDVPDGGTIQFNPALNGQTIALTSGALVIEKNVNLDGPGLDLLAVSRSSSDPFCIIHVKPGRTVTIKGLTITNGGGGGVWNDHATLTLNSCSVANNFSPDRGGGIYSDGSGSSATLRLLDSVVRNNSVAPQPGGSLPTGGGIANNATLIIDHSQVTGNAARAYWSSGIYLGNGGGISNNGPNAILTITNSVISNNVAGMPLSGSNANETGLSNSSAATLRHSTPKNNRSFGPPLTLMPNQSGNGGGIDNSNGGTLTITSTTLSGNSATFIGGGLYGNGTVTNCTISTNQAWSGSGGGIYGDHIVANCTIMGNTASFNGGGIAGNPTITNSTISGNHARYDGGGIYGSPSITNSTIDRNTVEFGNGGGINGGGFIRHCTISDNTGGSGGGILATAPLEIGNTILKTGSSGANIAINGGTITSHGYNISDDNGTGFLIGPGDQINTNPMLGPLQNNGGPTFTHELLAGSPAINTGDPNFIPPPSTDQRGYARVYEGRIDIGSFEVQPIPTPTPTPTPPRPLNISTRLRVQTGDNVGIAGFIITGSAPKTVALRGIGPSLSFFVFDWLDDPILELRAANGALLFQNDNWQDDPAQATQLSALFLAPGDPKESGIVAALTPGASYTAILKGKEGGTGAGVVEVYDTDQAAHSELANISTRGFVQTGTDVMIGGFILGGSGNSVIVVPAIGPSLSQFGVSNALADPTLELRGDNGTLLVANDNWQDDPDQAAQLTARGFAPSNPNESGILASLPPGNFTAVLAGRNGSTGVGLIEIYNLQ